MQKNKISGILMISCAIISILLITAYTVLFSIFGIISGGSFLMITPLLIIATIIIISLSFLLRAGIKQIKK